VTFVAMEGNGGLVAAFAGRPADGNRSSLCGNDRELGDWPIGDWLIFHYRVVL